MRAAAADGACAQFHPEAMGGPQDTEFLFSEFLDRVRKPQRSLVTTVTLRPNHGAAAAHGRDGS